MASLLTQIRIVLVSNKRAILFTHVDVFKASDHWEMQCWFKQQCSKDGARGLCLNKVCLSEVQQQNWSKESAFPLLPLSLFFSSNNSLSFFTRFFIESPQRHQTEPPPPQKKKSRLTRDFTKLLFSTTCTLSASDVGCYVEQPASSTGKSLDKQAFSSTDSFIADSATTTPSSQIAGLPIIFDDLDSSSSTSTSASPEAEYLLGQNNLDQEGGYSLTNNNMPNTGEFRSS